MKGPVLPSNFDKRGWQDLVRTLSLYHQTVHSGAIGKNYQVSGTVPVTCRIDLTSVSVTALAQAFAVLLTDLKKAGIIKLQETP